MDKIIDELKESGLIANPFIRGIIYTFTIIYIILGFLIVGDNLLAINYFENIDKVSDIFGSAGFILILLTFVSLIRDGDENIKSKKDLKENIKDLLNKKYKLNDDVKLIDIREKFKNHDKNNVVKYILQDLHNEGILSRQEDENGKRINGLYKFNNKK